MRQWLIVLLLASWLASSKAAQPATPDAGALLQQFLPLTKPVAGSGDSGLMFEQTDGSRLPLPTNDTILVQRIRITRNTLFDTKILLALVTHAEGQTLTLSQLGELAGLVTKYYRNHGYPLSRAIIPAQTIASGLLRIEVIEVHFGEIQLDNSSQVRDAVLQGILSNLRSGQDISETELDYALLSLSDLAGVKVDARLRPGRIPGTSDLLVLTQPGPALSASVTQDNSGDGYTGRQRVGSTFNLNNPLHRGDTLGITALSSGKGINYARVSYESIVNGRGTKMGGAYSSLNYVLGGTIAPLQAHGTAQEAGLWLRQPLLRSKSNNVYAQLQYEGLKLRDHVDTSQIQTDRSLENWTLNLFGDMRDQLLAGGINNWGLTWTNGRVTFDDAAAQLANGATANIQGRFSKWTANLARLQGLSRSTTLYLKIAAQGASTNLDSSQKFALGGLSGVRAYNTGVLSGDTGYLLNAELRYELGRAWQGQWQALLLLDSAHAVVNKNAWIAGPNSATLSGAGLGLNWTGPDQWSVRTTFAVPLGSSSELLSTPKSLRAWLEVRRGF